MTPRKRKRPKAPKRLYVVLDPHGKVSEVSRRKFSSCEEPKYCGWQTRCYVLAPKPRKRGRKAK